MTDEYYLFRGCLIPTRLPFLEKAAVIVLNKLGVEFEYLPSATCCIEPIGLRSIAVDTWLAVTARMLSIAETGERDILTLCNGCFMSLKEAAHLLSDPELRERINAVLSEIGMEYGGTTRVKHIIEVIRDFGPSRIGQLIERPLNRRVAVHPGCHILRPSRILDVDRPFNPGVLTEIARWVGADVVYTPDWPKCCGGGLTGVDEGVSGSILRETVQDFEMAGAELIVTPCPFCFVQLDLKQENSLPVMYLAEMLGWSFGSSGDELGLKNHRTKIPL